MSIATRAVMVRFDHRWAESATLQEGSLVQLRLVRPSDKAQLRRAFTRLSPDSRYRRFLAAKDRLTDADLQYLTEVDGWNHTAIAAIDEVTREGIGIARFVRLPGESTVAEAAITVADDWAERGLGRLLLDRLVEAAHEREVEIFRVEVLARDAGTIRLIREIAPGSTCRACEGVVCVEVRLLGEPESARDARALLKMVAGGALEAVPPRPPLGAAPSP